MERQPGALEGPQAPMWSQRALCRLVPEAEDSAMEQTLAQLSQTLDHPVEVLEVQVEALGVPVEVLEALAEVSEVLAEVVVDAQLPMNNNAPQLMNSNAPLSTSNNAGNGFSQKEY